MQQEPSIHTDNLSYQIFSILENNFLFGNDYQKQVSVTPMASIDDGGAKGKICLLSIDGGGMLSNVIAGKALAHLENALKEKSGDPEARIADYIDVAAGTGLGGVLVAMLFGTDNQTVPLFKAEDTWRFLAEQKKRVYNTGSSSGSTSGGILKKIFLGGGSGLSNATTRFDNAMKKAFVVNGRSLTLKDTLKPVLIPCYDLSSSATFMFSRADALEDNNFNFRLWEICHATSAEPEVCEHVLIKSINGKTRCIAVGGGLAMSNPTLSAITHVLHNKNEFPVARGVEDLLVISLGSGQPIERNYDYEQVKKWKAKDWARHVARISSGSLADMVDDVVAMLFGQNQCSNYVRIQVHSNMGKDVDTDPSLSDLSGLGDEMLKQKNVESLLFGGKRISDQTNFEKLEWFAGELVTEHRMRSGRFAPTVAFKQTTA